MLFAKPCLIKLAIHFSGKRDESGQTCRLQKGALFANPCLIKLQQEGRRNKFANKFVCYTAFSSALSLEMHV